MWLPQLLHLDTQTTEPVRVEFRVRQAVEQTVRAQVRCGDKVVGSKRLRYARPSEMITVELAPDKQKMIDGDLNVELVGPRGERLDG